VEAGLGELLTDVELQRSGMEDAAGGRVALESSSMMSEGQDAARLSGVAARAVDLVGSNVTPWRTEMGWEMRWEMRPRC